MFGKSEAMKVIIFVMLAILPITLAAQTEITFNMGSGLFFFRGHSAGDGHIRSDGRVTYYGEAYGSTPNISLNTSLDFKRKADNNICYGINLGYDIFRSSVKINYYFDSFYTLIPVESQKAIFTMHSISCRPYFGTHNKTKNAYLDILFGLELSKTLDMNGTGVIRIKEGVEIEVNDKRDHNFLDLRPSITLCRTNNTFGFFATYSHGIRNFLETEPEFNFLEGSGAYAVCFRLGVNYNLKKIRPGN